MKSSIRQANSTRQLDLVVLDDTSSELTSNRSTRFLTDEPYVGVAIRSQCLGNPGGQVPNAMGLGAKQGRVRRWRPQRRKQALIELRIPDPLSEITSRESSKSRAHMFRRKSETASAT